MRPAGRTEVTTEEFVDAYLGSRSLSEIAAKLGITRSGVQHRTRTLRLKGVRLPYFREPLTPSSVAFLNQQIDNHRTRTRKKEK